MKYGALKAWDLSGGRLARWNAEAVEEYAQARMSGDWYDLSRTQKAKWIARNPLAWMRGQSFSQRYKAVKRTQEYERDVAFVRDYLARTGTGGKKSSMIKESDPDTGDESDTTADDIENAAERTSDALDIAGSASELADEAQGLEDGSARTAGIGYASSALGMGLNAYGLYKAGKDLKESRQQGDSRGRRFTASFPTPWTWAETLPASSAPMLPKPPGACWAPSRAPSTWWPAETPPSAASGRSGRPRASKARCCMAGPARSSRTTSC